MPRPIIFMFLFFCWLCFMGTSARDMPLYMFGRMLDRTSLVGQIPLSFVLALPWITCVVITVIWKLKSEKRIKSTESQSTSDMKGAGEL